MRSRSRSLIYTQWRALAWAAAVPLLFTGCSITRMAVEKTVHTVPIQSADARYRVGECTAQDNDFGTEDCEKLKDFVQFELLKRDLDAQSQSDTDRLISLSVNDYWRMSSGGRAVIGAVASLAAPDDRIEVLVQLSDREAEPVGSFSLLAKGLGGFAPESAYRRLAAELVGLLMTEVVE